MFKYVWIYMWIKLNQVNVSEYPKSQFSDPLILPSFLFILEELCLENILKMY